METRDNLNWKKRQYSSVITGKRAVLDIDILPFFIFQEWPCTHPGSRHSRLISFVNILINWTLKTTCIPSQEPIYSNLCYLDLFIFEYQMNKPVATLIKLLQRPDTNKEKSNMAACGKFAYFVKAFCLIYLRLPHKHIQ